MHPLHLQHESAAAESSGAPSGVTSHLARRVLRDAVLLGVAASALLHQGPGGIAFPIWVALLAAVLAFEIRHLGDWMQREPALWLAGALLFATMHALDAAELLAGLDVLATLGCLVMAGITVSRVPVPSILLARVRDLVVGGARAVRSAMIGAIPLALRDTDWSTVGRAMSTRGMGAAIRATVLTLPLLLVFGALLRSADPMFAALLTLPAIDAERVFSHLLVGGFFAWISAGWLRALVVERDAPQRAHPLQLPALGAIEIGTALGTVSALFAAFVLVQLRWMFGGEAIVRATTGLGYAEYARRGFFELLWVAMLTIPLLLGLDILTPRGDARARRRFRVLGRVLLALLALVVASALSRMTLYVRYYGLSLDRLYATAFMLWIGVVLAWLALTVLRDRPRLFAAGMILSALTTLLVLHVMRPDRLVALHNLDRRPIAAATDGERPVDIAHLATLGPGAMAIVVPAVLSAPANDVESMRLRCEAATRVLHRLGKDGEGLAWSDWRLWNPTRARGLQVVREHRDALRATCANVPRPPGSSPRPLG